MYVVPWPRPGCVKDSGTSLLLHGHWLGFRHPTFLVAILSLPHFPFLLPFSRLPLPRPWLPLIPEVEDPPRYRVQPIRSAWMDWSYLTAERF